MTITLNKLKKARFCCLMLFFFLILFIKSFHAIDIPQMFVLAIAVILPFCFSPQEIAAYIACFSMLGTGIQIAYVCMACIISLFVKTKMQLKMIQIIVPAIFLCNELIRIAIYPEDELIEAIRYVIVFFLIIYILSSDLSQNDRRKIVDACIFSTAFVVILVLIETLSLSEWNMSSLLNGSLRLGYSQQLNGALYFSADPNMLGQSCSLAISLCLMLISSEGVKMKYLIAMAICLLGGTLTISKTFFLSLVVIFLLVLFGTGTKNNALKSLLQKCGFLVLVVLLVFVVYKVNPSYIENLLSRVDYSDVTTGRTENAMVYIEALSSDAIGLLFGKGMQNVGDKVGFTGSPHAATVEMIVCWGVVGTVIIGGLLIYATYWHAKNKNVCFLNFIPILVFACVVQTTQLFRLRDHVLCLIVVIVTCGLELGKDKKYEKKSTICY